MESWKGFDEEDERQKFQTPFYFIQQFERIHEISTQSIISFIFTYMNMPSSIFDDLYGNAAMTVLFE